jgi:hypothetical protein
VITSIRKSAWGATAFASVKSLVKGKEVHTLIKDVLSDIGVIG